MGDAAPHHLPTDFAGLCLTAAGISVALSLWALHVDPVINNDGILYIEAAGYFAVGDWSAAFAVYKWPFYSLLISGINVATGLAPGHSAYLLNAALYIVLVLGFVALVRALGGGKTAMWAAAVIALAHPVLNEFRAFIIRDVGYWACYLWSLAYFFAYLKNRDGALLALWGVFTLLAFLFRIEGIVMAAVLPACLYVARTNGSHRAAAIFLLAGLGALVVAVSPIWHYISAIGAGAGPDLQPVQHIIDSWRAGMEEVASRLDALERDFPGIAVKPVSIPVYLLTAVLIGVVEVIESLGVVFSALVVYAGLQVKRTLPEPQRCWWLVVVIVQTALVFLFVLSSFFLAERYPVGLALVLLAIVPLAVEYAWEEQKKQGARHTWRAAAVALLLAIEGVDGLDLATEKQHIKDAGLWLRQHAPPGSTVYSNNRIFVYYSGLEESKPDADYTWQQAMTELWTGAWRTYDYFALALNKRDTRNRVLLLRKFEKEPLRTFESGGGDQVLVFRGD